MINNKIQDAWDMEKKSTYSDKLYNTSSVVSSLAAVGLHLLTLVTFIISRDHGLTLWMYIFYPMLIFNIAGIYLSFAQVFRNRYFSSTLAAALSVINLVAIVVVIILQATILKTVYIIPFNFI